MDDGQGNVTSYQYDLNGNMTSDSSGRAITWSPFDKPTQITNLLTTLNFTYGVERNRIIQTDNAGKTVHYVGGLYERETTPSGTSHTHYLVAGGSTVAIVKTDNSLNMETRYLHRDHLDSIAVITDETGTVVERLSYDPHGRRRHDADWADMGTVLPGAVTDRGYTGHEHLDEVGLIHMNGRVQDPVLGRFISADPFIPDPSDAQSYNRYSYVRNNPLSFTDPSGFIDIFLEKRLPFVPQQIHSGATMVTGSPSPIIFPPSAWETGYLAGLDDPYYWDPYGSAGFLNAQSGILGGIVQSGSYNWNPAWHQTQASQIGIPLAPGQFLAPMTVTITRSGNNTTYVINYNRQGSGGTTTPASTSATHTHATPGMGAGASPANSPHALDEGVDLLFFTSLAGIAKATTKYLLAGAVKGGKRLIDDAVDFWFNKGNVKNALHKNSLDYVGETHVYRIKGPNGSYRIGESAQGTRVRDGASIRAELQARKFRKETGDIYETDIRRTFSDKRSAREYETRLINRFRQRYGQEALPGNNTNR